MLIFTREFQSYLFELFIGPVVDCGRARALSHCHIITNTLIIYTN